MCMVFECELSIPHYSFKHASCVCIVSPHAKIVTEMCIPHFSYKLKFDSLKLNIGILVGVLAIAWKVAK